MSARKTHRRLTCLIAGLFAAPVAWPWPPITDKEESILEYRVLRAQTAMREWGAEEFARCVGDSPLNSRRSECGRQGSSPIYDLARQSETNCFSYYARGTRELWECRADGYERALQSLREKTEFKPFEAPDGSSKSRKNTFKKI